MIINMAYNFFSLLLILFVNISNVSSSPVIEFNGCDGVILAAGQASCINKEFSFGTLNGVLLNSCTPSPNAIVTSNFGPINTTVNFTYEIWFSFQTLTPREVVYTLPMGEISTHTEIPSRQSRVSHYREDVQFRLSMMTIDPLIVVGAPGPITFIHQLSIGGIKKGGGYCPYSLFNIFCFDATPSYSEKINMIGNHIDTLFKVAVVVENDVASFYLKTGEDSIEYARMCGDSNMLFSPEQTRTVKRPIFENSRLRLGCDIGAPDENLEYAPQSIVYHRAAFWSRALSEDDILELWS